MSKILVEVYVPSANLTYDVYIPIESKISEITQLISNAITDVSDNKYRQGLEITLCNFSTGKEYDKNLRVFETDMDNGSKLMLV